MKTARHTDRRAAVLFPALVFLAFALSAFLLVLYGVRAYRHIASDSYAGRTCDTALNYVSEKVHRADMAGCVSVGSFNDLPAIVLTSEAGGEVYRTYIYEYKGSLMELSILDGVPAPSSAGSAIIELAGFTADMAEDGLMHVTAGSEDGSSSEIYISIRSGGAGS